MLVGVRKNGDKIVWNVCTVYIQVCESNVSNSSMCVNISTGAIAMP